MPRIGAIAGGNALRLPAWLDWSMASLLDLKLLSSGKVREIYEFEDDLLMVASDRISTYDVVMPTPIRTRARC